MRRLALQGLLVAIFLSMGALAQTSFNYAAINVPGAKMTVANGINNSNVIVGSYVPNGSTHTYGFRLHSGAYSKISVPNSTRTSAGGINDYGDVVGTYSLPGTTSQPANSHGFLLHAGVYKTINCPNGKFTSARSINEYGEIVGSCETSVGHVGFIYKSGTFKFVNAPTNGGPPDTDLNGVSNLGEIAGQVFAGDNERGFWMVGSDMDFLKPLLAKDNIAEGVNGHGDIVGCNVSKAFLAHNPESGETVEGSSESFPLLITLSPFGSKNSCAQAITYNRAIVGWYYDSSFVQHGFLATPK